MSCEKLCDFARFRRNLTLKDHCQRHLKGAEGTIS